MCGVPILFVVKWQVFSYRRNCSLHVISSAPSLNSRDIRLVTCNLVSRVRREISIYTGLISFPRQIQLSCVVLSQMSLSSV